MSTKSKLGYAFDKANDTAEAFVQDKLPTDNRAQMGIMDKGVELVVGVLVVGLLSAFLLPVALDEINAVDTSSWSSGTANLWDLQGIFFVLAVLLFVIGAAMNARR